MLFFVVVVVVVVVFLFFIFLSLSLARCVAILTIFLIASLHVTSWRPCWWSRIIACLLRLELNFIFMQILGKKLYCIDHQHGHVVENQE